MAITVRHLIEQPELSLTFRPGATGLDREILWVHASDLAHSALTQLVARAGTSSNNASFTSSGASTKCSP